MFAPIVGSGPWRCHVWLDPRSLWSFCVIGAIRRTFTTDRHIIQVIVLVTVLVVMTSAGLPGRVALVAATGYLMQEIVRQMAKRGHLWSWPQVPSPLLEG